jgi:hypothetical protein
MLKRPPYSQHMIKKRSFYLAIPPAGARVGANAGAHAGAHGAGMQLIVGTGTGTPVTRDGKPEQYTPGEPA